MIAIRLKSGSRVVREVVFKDLPVRIGRGPENDLVLFDASVSSAHAVIEEDPANGRPILRDLGSRNGTHANGALVATAPIGRTLECMIGLTELEIESLSGEATSKVDVHAWQQYNRRRGFHDHARAVGLGAFGWLAFTVGNPSFWSPWEQNPVVTLLWGVMGVVVALPASAFVLLIGLRAAGRKVRIADALDALARLVWLLPAQQLLALLAYYLLPTAVSLLFDTAVIGALFVIGVVHVGDLRRRPANLSFRLALGAGAAILYAGLIGTSLYAARERGTPQTDYRVYPPFAGFSGTAKALDRYLDAIQEAATDADREAERRRNERKKAGE